MFRRSAGVHCCLTFILGLSSCSDDIAPLNEEDEEFSFDLPADAGEYDFEDGSTYKGELLDGEPHGFGRHFIQL